MTTAYERTQAVVETRRCLHLSMAHRTTRMFNQSRPGCFGTTRSTSTSSCLLRHCRGFETYLNIDHVQIFDIVVG